MRTSSGAKRAPKLQRLSLRDRPLFERYLHRGPHRLLLYSFANIYIWQGLFEIYWTLIDDALCVFFKDACGCFMYLPPLSAGFDPATVRSAWTVMDGFNRNPAVSRIENIEEDAVAGFSGCGLDCFEKSGDYLYRRSAMAALAGDRFKSKRADCNYFLKHHGGFVWRPYQKKDKAACIALYDRWAGGRAAKYSDPLYCGLLADSRNAFMHLLGAYGPLDAVGRVVECGGRLAACTFGCAVSPRVFCVQYEVAEPAMRGLSQYVFRRFCEELDTYEYINAMDDSGLENLTRVKLSYHPEVVLKNYVARTRN